MDDWVGKGKVRARLVEDDILEAKCNGLTTQAKYYKPLFKEFFRKDFQIRPSYGDFEVHIIMEYTGDPPMMDLDNLAKALLDSLTGAAFFDDSQVARLLVERREGERERIMLRCRSFASGSVAKFV
tara:strand:+ start:8952 stop:9329 length:378 start_codon:yes stop_codon:yes gene_type:complete